MYSKSRLNKTETNKTKQEGLWINKEFMNVKKQKKNIHTNKKTAVYLWKSIWVVLHTNIVFFIKYNSSFSNFKKQTQHRVCGVLTEISVLYCQPTECIYLRLMVPCATAACFYIQHLWFQRVDYLLYLRYI